MARRDMTSASARDLSPGVNVAGYFRAEVGVGEAGRLLLTALRAAGVRYSVVPFGDVPSRQESAFSDWGEHDANFDTNIVCVNSNALPAFLQAVGWGFFENRYTIGMWWWEVEDFPEEMRVGVDLVDEVWVGSRHAADAIAPVITKPVLICPPPVAPPAPATVTRAQVGLPEGFVFLFLFDFNSVVDRKNPTGLIRAFSRAFEPGEGPTLVLKSVNGYQHPAKLESVRASAAGRPDILIMDKYLDERDLHSLVASADSYVSLHRAEGFGLTMAEAMALGKPVIGTGYAGNLEFMNDRNSWLVPYELTTIPPGCEPYPAGSRWAEPDLDAAAVAMRKVFTGGADVRARSQQAAHDIRVHHSAEARARFLRLRLQTIYSSRAKRRSSAKQGAVAATTFGGPGLANHPGADLRNLVYTPGAGGIKRRVLVFVRKFMYRLIAPLLVSQAEYNLATAQAVDQLRATVAAQGRALEELAGSIDGSENHPFAREAERDEERRGAAE